MMVLLVLSSLLVLTMLARLLAAGGGAFVLVPVFDAIGRISVWRLAFGFVLGVEQLLLLSQLVLSQLFQPPAFVPV